jgi:hypothetical protein
MENQKRKRPEWTEGSIPFTRSIMLHTQQLHLQATQTETAKQDKPAPLSWNDLIVLLYRTKKEAPWSVQSQ